MAEIMQQPDNKKGRRMTKKSTRVDLTPMVDLGFLLITFFIFTTTMSSPMSLKMNMPDDKPTNDPTVASGEKTIQLILEGNNQISYYMGDDSLHKSTTDYSAEGLRNVILTKQKEIAEKYHQPDELVILIKPSDRSSYKNVVDVLDEMMINGIKRYMLL